MCASAERMRIAGASQGAFVPCDPLRSGKPVERMRKAGCRMHDAQKLPDDVGGVHRGSEQEQRKVWQT